MMTSFKVECTCYGRLLIHLDVMNESGVGMTAPISACNLLGTPVVFNMGYMRLFKHM